MTTAQLGAALMTLHPAKPTQSAAAEDAYYQRHTTILAPVFGAVLRKLLIRLVKFSHKTMPSGKADAAATVL